VLTAIPLSRLAAYEPTGSAEPHAALPQCETATLFWFYLSSPQPLARKT
jgi:hypothetical protein